MMLSELSAEVMRKLEHKVAVGRRSAGTIDFRRDCAKHLLGAFGDRPITDFAGPAGFKLVYEYIEAEELRGIKGGTIQKRIGALSLLTREARNMGVLATVPTFPRVDGGYKPKTRYLTRGEYDKLRACLRYDRQVWLDVALFTAMHDSDIGAMSWTDLRLKEGELQFCRHNTKNRADQIWCKAPRELVALFAADPRVGVTPGLVVGPWPAAVRDLKRACTRAGIPDICLLDLRRTFATWWMDAGGDKGALKDYLGHSQSSKMVDWVYARITPRRIAAGVDALAA